MSELECYAERNYFLIMPSMYFKAQKQGMKGEANNILSLSRTHNHNILSLDVGGLKSRGLLSGFSPRMFFIIMYVYSLLCELKNKSINLVREKDTR